MKNEPYEHKIQYYETDQMGIVHHSNYIRFMEEARNDMLCRLGLPYEEIEQAGLLVPVLAASCEYLLPARYGETLLLLVNPVTCNGVRMTLSYEMLGKEDGRLHAKGQSSHAFLDRQLKPVRMKRDYPELYEKLMSLFPPA